METERVFYFLKTALPTHYFSSLYIIVLSVY